MFHLPQKVSDLVKAALSCVLPSEADSRYVLRKANLIRWVDVLESPAILPRWR